MGAPDIPKQKEAQPPVREVDAEAAGDAEKKYIKERKGGMSSWLTRGQSLGSGNAMK